VALKAAVTLACCAVLPPKLLDTHLHPRYWLGRPLHSWLAYLVNPFILVHRLHGDAPVNRAAGRRLAMRGLFEMALGGFVLWYAFHVIDSRGPGRAISFWLEHAIKLLGAYLLAFDGLFVFATGIIRMLGGKVLDLSRNPAAAATPADFWRAYNCEAGRFLREDVFFPLGGRRHPIRLAAVAFLINGLLHEYLALIMVGRITGYQMMFFTLHGAAAAATLRWRPHRWARLAGIVTTVLFLYFTSILFFATIDLFLPWHARDIVI
jgi:D-alanyl-lipoteichoic acid acyltransferase DltB (MBOAT superfamily)